MKTTTQAPTTITYDAHGLICSFACLDQAQREAVASTAARASARSAEGYILASRHAAARKYAVEDAE